MPRYGGRARAQRKFDRRKRIPSIPENNKNNFYFLNDGSNRFKFKGYESTMNYTK